MIQDKGPMIKGQPLQYPLREKIGDPDLFVGREKEFRNFGKWLDFIPKQLSKSRVILARRKSGKTAFVQRIFNQLWSANGEVIPFYLDIAENKVWLPNFAMKYYRAFASQYISFLERDQKLVSKLLSLEQIKAYGLAKSNELLVDDVTSLLFDKEMQAYDLMWDTAYTAPHRFADFFEQRFLVILDEFQNLAQYIYPDSHFQTAPIETMPGSFHSVSESKIAPMLVTGSYVSWLLKISGKYLQAGRLSPWRMPPYLPAEEGLRAVYKYAEVYDEPITNETAVQINQLCMSDPFFISCVMRSNYEGRHLTVAEGVVNTVNYEISYWDSEMSKNWNEYIQLTLHKVNDLNGKNILLYLSKHNDRYWSHRELKEALQLEMSLDEIKQKLLLLVEADVIERGVSDIDFRGLQDGTLNLILRNRFEKEISAFVPDLKMEFHQEIKKLQQEKQQLQGMFNNLSGQFAELQLVAAFRGRKQFALSDYFEGASDTAQLTIEAVRQRQTFQTPDGKNWEIDVMVEADSDRVVLVEVRKRQVRMGIKMVEAFQEKATAYRELFPDKTILPAFLSLGGFTGEAELFCRATEIGLAERIEYF